ncbi:MAG: 6-bladed beta-propeller [Candidatus Latescibacteria bacterium]|nr:6-bladed beta-propeller [Candidatus Latescibacterota bacterium]
MALVLHPEQEEAVQLLFFDLDFQQIDEQTLLNTASSIREGIGGTLSVSTAQNPEGQRFFSIATSPNFSPAVTYGVLSWGPDGQMIVQEHLLFTDAFPAPLAGAEGEVLGEIALLGGSQFDNVAVSTGDRLLFAEDFSAFTASLEGATEAIHGWEFSTLYFLNSGRLNAGARQSVARRVDEAWQDFRLEADVVPFIQIGGDTFSRFTLQFDIANQQVLLNWDFVPPAELGLEAQHQTFTAPFQLLNGLFYRMSLEVVDGQVRAAVKSPVLWAGVKGAAATWSNLVALGNSLACTVNEQAYSLTPQGQATLLSSFPSRVSELRVWEAGRGHNMGVCLPEQNQIFLGLVPATKESSWSTFIREAGSIGPRIGPEQGYLFYPLSFGVGPDGRVYVLDAGNGRIVVFDQKGRYVTQWGRRGDGPGEFDFGRGDNSGYLNGDLDYAGSLAVDSQGYIYVADEVNKRIQKFAP